MYLLNLTMSVLCVCVFRSVRISRKYWHMLVNLCLHIFLTCGVFVGGINQTRYASVCQAVSIPPYYPPYPPGVQAYLPTMQTGNLPSRAQSISQLYGDLKMLWRRQICLWQHSVIPDSPLFSPRCTLSVSTVKSMRRVEKRDYFS